MKFVAPLRDFGRDDISSAGGKGANLGELVRCEVPVPDGFVITTAGYAAAVQPLDLRLADLVPGRRRWRSDPRGHRDRLDALRPAR